MLHRFAVVCLSLAAGRGTSLSSSVFTFSLIRMCVCFFFFSFLALSRTKTGSPFASMRATALWPWLTSSPSCATSPWCVRCIYRANYRLPSFLPSHQYSLILTHCFVHLASRDWSKHHQRIFFGASQKKCVWVCVYVYIYMCVW